MPDLVHRPRATDAVAVHLHREHRGEALGVHEATGHPAASREEVNQPRTTDYPFSLFEMRFDSQGKGQGKGGKAK